MRKPPAFQLYAADFFMDTADWTCVQVGAYIRLLLYEWINGALPSGVSDLARIANIDRRTMAKMWTQKLAKKFQLNEAKMLVNPRLEDERRKQREHREKQEKSGRKGGLKTQEKRRKESSEPSSEPSSENKPLQSSYIITPIVPLKRGQSKSVYADGFLEFWKAYPNKSGKDAAWRMWEKRKKKGTLPPLETILKAIEDQKAWRDNAAPGDFRPEWKNPATWINQGCWADEVPKTKAPARTESRATAKGTVCPSCGKPCLESDLIDGGCYYCKT